MKPLFRSWALDEIGRLDPVRDHQQIVLLSTRVDFPFDTTRALELALFRTFGVPSTSPPSCTGRVSSSGARRSATTTPTSS